MSRHPRGRPRPVDLKHPRRLRLLLFLGEGGGQFPAPWAVVTASSSCHVHGRGPHPWAGEMERRTLGLPRQVALTGQSLVCTCPRLRGPRLLARPGMARKVLDSLPTLARGFHMLSQQPWSWLLQRPVGASWPPGVCLTVRPELNAGEFPVL